MEPLTFDKLSDVLATNISRRHAPKTFVASIVAGAFGLRRTKSSQAMTTTSNPNDCGQVGDNDSLWMKVHQEVEDCQKAEKTIPNACANRRIYPTKGYCLMQDAPNLLLVATDRITGIECPKLWGQGGSTPHYWEIAWTDVAKQYLKGHEDRIGMAINSKLGSGGQRVRDYDQLHIHVSCIKTGVQKYLDEKDSAITTSPEAWKKNPLTIDNYEYRVLRLDKDDDLKTDNLFKLLRDHVATDDADMQYQTLVVAKRPKGGFYNLNSQGNLAHFHGTGAGEKNLLDEKCS